jgi:hypothetical protein
MTTHLPRKAYTTEELAQLYPKELELQLVQVVSYTFPSSIGNPERQYMLTLYCSYFDMVG